jgi:lactoylglutathione lyase
LSITRIHCTVERRRASHEAAAAALKFKCETQRRPEPIFTSEQAEVLDEPRRLSSPEGRVRHNSLSRGFDQERSREFYRSLFDGQVLLERDPVIIKVANTWLILNVGGGPTDDKPTVTLTTPHDPSRTSAFLNIRVADIHKVYKEWSAKGAEFLTEPKDHGRVIRAYIRDPDGHLIEVGQATGILS